MYIHLGGGAIVRKQDIVGVFDIEYCSTDKRTREFLSKAAKHGTVVSSTDDIPKSFIVCDDGHGNQTLYISGVATATIRKRAAMGVKTLQI